MSYKLGSNRGRDSFTSFKKQGLINCDNPPCDPYDSSKNYDPSKKIIIEEGTSNISKNNGQGVKGTWLDDGGKAEEINKKYKGLPKLHELDAALDSKSYRQELNKKYGYNEDADDKQWTVLRQKVIDHKDPDLYVKTKMIRND